MKKKLKVVAIVAIECEPEAADHLGMKQGLEWLEDKVEYQLVDPVIRGAEDIIQKIIRYQPDVVIHYMDNSFNVSAPSKIAEQVNCKQVFWELDYRPLAHNIEQSYNNGFSRWKEEMQYIDHIFLSNKGQIEAWKKNFNVPVSYLPHGCYVLNKPVFDREFQYPCVFIGGMNDGDFFIQRKKIIGQIMEKTKVIHINESDRDKRNQVWANMHKIYYSSDTVLDISHEWNNAGYASGRYFYIGGYGGCSITKRFPDCEDLYPEGTKIYFDTANEAVEKIEYYKKNKKEQKKVKEFAFEHNKKYHSFKTRLETILQTLDYA